MKRSYNGTHNHHKNVLSFPRPELKNHETKSEQYTHHVITRSRRARQPVVIPVLRNVFLEMELRPEGEIRITSVNNEGKC